ncbi:MAG: SusC/RagA family TonB-linked outer membrane protein [Prevotellaceae bacterium]|jgi:TonB-linked SusC/RagA family outer membrane protein|nr:SusC/RagA family TonB-linked outer membrane protein [Prevotellaceae bacterium]
MNYFKTTVQFFVLLCLSVLPVAAFGQTTVTGTVTDKYGSPLAGASVAIKGSGKATMADIDGKFILTGVEAGEVLAVSFLGYQTKEIPVGSETTYTVVLGETAAALDEVVVTALGIKRAKKALTYNVQEIPAAEITKVKSASFVNSLAGKVAGVDINSSSSGIGGSTRVVMRGLKSLFGNNNALYVIDGMPLPELRTAQPESFYEVPDGGDGDGISNINPEDIAGITVLTGAAAAALYGNMGANGVILITTKRGEAGRTKVSYSNNTSFSSPFLMPKFQQTYGSEIGSPTSWGDKMTTPSTYNPADFFQTGFNTINSLTVSSGTERNQTFVSVSSLNARGIVPNNLYNRYNFTVRNSTALMQQGDTDVLTLDMNFSYIRQNDQNMVSQGRYYNPLVPIYLFPPSDDITKYQLYETYDMERGFRTQNWKYGDLGLNAQNPYWIVNRNMFNSDRDRFMLGAALKYTMTDWLNITGRAQYDRMAMHYTRKIYASSLTLFASDFGNYLEAKTDNQYFYGDVIANINQRWNDFTLTANIGASIVDNQSDMSGFEGHLMNVANWFHALNTDKNNHGFMNQEVYREQTQSVFATAQFGYKSIYLDLSARNDWASTFAGTNTGSFFYPSVGLSTVVTDLVDINRHILSFLKIRGTYSEVGSPPLRYITFRQYEKEKEGGSPLPETYGIKPATDLQPERTKAFELGANIILFKDKITLDLTYYNTNTYNQLFLREQSPTIAGFRAEYVNAGKVNNYGLELSAALNQKLGPVDWRLGVTYSFNKNEIKELLPGADEMDIMTVGTYKSRLVKGGSVGDIYSNGLRTDHEGNIFVDATQGTIAPDYEKWYKLGNTEPKYNLGISNSFRFKGISLDFMVTARVGGVGTSTTQAIMDQFGVSQATADTRDAGGIPVNYGEVTPTNWYSVVAGGYTGLLTYYTYSMTNVRLKQASISYTLPSKLFKDKLDVTLSLIGQNLLMFYCKAPFDPELTSATSTYFQGFDYFMPPSVRSFGFGVNVTF